MKPRPLWARAASSSSTPPPHRHRRAVLLGETPPARQEPPGRRRPDSTPLWFSRVNRTHPRSDRSRARGIVLACLTRQVLIVADRAGQGAGATVRTPATATATYPSATSGTTATTPACALPGERAFGQAGILAGAARSTPPTPVRRTVQAGHILMTCQDAG
jgi:hypothetical protein